MKTPDAPGAGADGGNPELADWYPLVPRRSDPATAAMQFGIHSVDSGPQCQLPLGVDGFSMPLILLTAFVDPAGGDRRLGGGSIGLASTWLPS